MTISNKLKKRIYQLAVKKGYPHILLDFYTYQQVLKTAHTQVFQQHKN